MSDIMDICKIETASPLSAPQVQTSSGSGFAELLSEISSEGKSELDEIFERAAEKYNLPVNLLKAIGKIESGFNPDAVSYAGAMGIMQLMPQTATYLGVTDPFDPEQNIMGGAKLLSEHLEQYDGNMELAIAAYNCGVGTVAKYGGTVPPFTVNYLKKIEEAIGGGLTIPEGIIGSGSSNPISYTLERSTSSGMTNSMKMMFLAKYMEMMMDSSGDEDKDKKLIP